MVAFTINNNFIIFLYSVYDYRTDNSYVSGLIGFIVMITGVGISLGIVLGHFLWTIQ